jgi:hypothetical protein
MLLGGANISGLKWDNTKQLQLAQKAEVLTESIATDIENAYLDGFSFVKKSVMSACRGIKSKAQSFIDKNSATNPHRLVATIDFPHPKHRKKISKRKNN